MRKVFRKNLLFGFAGRVGDGGGGGEGLDDVGIVELGGGGVRGTLSAGIVRVVVGVAGVGFELSDVATEPGGSGSEVLALADPGRTIGLESEIEGLSTYPLCCRKS